MSYLGNMLLLLILILLLSSDTTPVSAPVPTAVVTGNVVGDPIVAVIAVTVEAIGVVVEAVAEIGNLG